MKIILFIFSLLLASFESMSQITGEPEEQEQLAEQQAAFTDDGSLTEELQDWKVDGVDLNSMEWQELTAMGVNSSQAESFFAYRSMLGPFIHVLELQAIPGWDANLVRKLIPLVKINPENSPLSILRHALVSGNQSLMLRASLSSVTLDNKRSGVYPGGPYSLLFRYSYNKPNTLQFGFLGEKDAGESFFRNAQKNGFDFYSIHFFLRSSGLIKSVALGDFVVNMGQGLVHWQGISFGRGLEVTQVKKQGLFLRPYRSAGEYYFHRGAAFEFSRKSIHLGLFFSHRNLDGRRIYDSTGNFTGFISSLSSTGYHRNESEIRMQGTQQRTVVGGRLSYQKGSLKLSLNSLYWHDRFPFQKTPVVYSLASEVSKGQSVLYSLDHQYTFRNFHFFGEMASAGFSRPAFLEGVVFSASHRADLSLIYRNFPPGFESPFGRGFAGSQPANEKGFFAGLQLSIAPGLRLRYYQDRFFSPWLRYRVNAPSAGQESGWQISCQLSKKSEVYVRVIKRKNEQNIINELIIINKILPYKLTGIRFHASVKVNDDLEIRMRAEQTRFFDGSLGRSRGWLYLMDLFYKPLGNRISGNFRLLFHSTDDYQSRIYAFENDVTGSASVLPFSGTGWKYYINVRYKITSGFSFWVRYARSLTGSFEDTGLAERNSEIKCQGFFTF